MKIKKVGTQRDVKCKLEDSLYSGIYSLQLGPVSLRISRKRQPGRNICICHKNFSVIIIKARAFSVKFARKRIAVYFSLSLSSPRLSAGTLISSFSFFMNNGGGLRFVFAAAIAAVAVAASGQFP